MSTTLHLETTILPGHRLELSDPNLPDGAKVEVTDVVPEALAPPRISMLDLVDSLPLGPRAFATWEEYERHLRKEKDSWDR